VSDGHVLIAMGALAVALIALGAWLL